MIPISFDELRRTLTVSRPSLVRDDLGGDNVVMTPKGDVCAMVSEPSAAERIAAMQAGADLAIVVHFRPDADVRRGDVLAGDGDVLRVKSTVIPSEPVYLRADCEQVQPEGDQP